MQCNCSAYPSHIDFHEAVAVGDTILIHVNGTTPAEHTFQKKNRVVTFGLKEFIVRTDRYMILIDPLLLFQKLTTAM